MFVEKELYCEDNFSKNNAKWTKGRYYKFYIKNKLYYLLDDAGFRYYALTEDEVYSNFSDIY